MTNLVSEFLFNDNNSGRTATPITVTLTSPPDLQVTAISIPAQALSGATIQAGWEVTNAGVGHAEGQWIDRVYFSADDQLGGDTLLGTFTHSAGLADGGSYTRTENFTLPETADGNYHLIVVTDAANAVYEHQNEDNNTTASEDAVAIVHPDLTVTAVIVPSGTVSGTDITVHWTAQNIGTGTTNVAAWTDTIYLSTDNSLSGSDTLLGELARNAALDASESYSAQQQFTLPNGISGTYYILIQTDRLNQVRETGSEANNVTAGSTNVTLAPYADLVPSGVTATSAIVIGNPAGIDVSWTVTNQGTGPGPVDAWQDRIVVSNNAVYGDADDRLVAEFGHSGALPVGGNYSRSERVALPANLAGQYHLFVATDSANAVYEYTFENNNVTEAGNLVSVRPVDFADLTVTSVVAPGSGSSGQPLTVTWTVTNQRVGATNVSSWQDRLVLSTDTVLGNGDDVTLGTQSHSGTLSGGASYTQTADVVLPQGIAGTRYVFVLADATDVVDEFLLDGNNSGQSDAVEISLTPPPDLQVTSITVPAQALTAGTLEVTWTVSNRGTAAATGDWTDRVYLSTDAVAGGDQLLGTFPHSGELAIDASYSRSETLTLTELSDDTYYVVVVTDSGDAVYEHVHEGNNTLVSAEAVSIVHPDLQVVSLTAPAESLSGTSVPIQWNVTNAGTGVTSGAAWYDAVYVSVDDKFDASDVLLSEFAHDGLLSVGASYARQEQVILPNGIFGIYYLLLRTDARSQMTETNAENNNLAAAASTVSLAPYADLVVSSLVSTADIVVGNPAQIDVSWTVRNQGTGSGPVDVWLDRIVVSSNAVYGDADDRLVGRVRPHRRAAGG